MRRRWTLFVATVGLAGCRLIVPLEPVADTADPPPIVDAIPVSRPKPEAASEAIPEPEDALSVAAEAVKSGHPERALGPLREHVARHPDQVMIRSYLAELLMRQGEDDESRQEFEAFVASAQKLDGPAKKHIIHCHTRLMELAAKREDAYEEKIQRGLGLYRLGEWQATQGGAELQPILCRAAAELREARKLRPDEARPAWYLAQCWEMLGQVGPARRLAAEAAALPRLGGFTPSERAALEAARRQEAWLSRR